MVDFVVEILKSTGDLYYPNVEQIVTTRSMPYRIDTAEISLAEEDASVSNVEVYDQAEIKVDDITIFSGRLDKKKASWNETGSTIKYAISDHGQVLDQINVSSAKSWAVPTAIGTILEDMRSSFVSADLTGTNISTGPNIAKYNVPAWGKKLITVFLELQRVSNYNLWVDFDKDINFEAKPSTPKDGFGILEGYNLIGINNYEKDVTAVRNYIKVIGDTGISAYAENSASQTAHHKREYKHTDPSLTTTDSCQAIADALIKTSPAERLSCTIPGDLTINPGDLAAVDIPKFNIDSNFEVAQVKHLIKKNSFITSLEVGEQVPTIDHIIASMDGSLSLLKGAYV